MEVNSPIIRPNRRCFDPPLVFLPAHPQDYIFRRANEVVEQYNQSQPPLQTFANPVHLSAINPAPTVFYDCDTSPVIHALYRTDEIILVALRLSRDFHCAWESSIVVVQVGGRWVPLREYLKSLRTDFEYLTGEKGYRVQSTWWKSLKKPFRLLDLPEKVGDKILLHMLGTRVEPTERIELNYNGGSTVALAMGSKSAEQPYMPYTKPLNLTVLQLSRNIADRTESILAQDTVKVFRNFPDLVELPQRIRPSLGFTIRHLDLSLDAHQMIWLFKVKLLPFQYDANFARWASFSDVRRTNLPALETLHLYFVPIGTSSHTAHLSPWLAHAKLHGFFQGSRIAWQDMGMDLLRPPCQPRLVESIMCFAARHLGGLREVRLGGLIHSHLKGLWEGILNSKKPQIHEKFLENGRRSVEALPCHELPLRCSCTPPCGIFPP